MAEASRGNVFRGAPYRGDWSFADLLDWHLLRGTRPNGSDDPSVPGTEWSNGEFASCVGDVKEYDLESGRGRKVENWRNGKNRPSTLGPIEKVLFGEDVDAFKNWRADLHRAYRLAKRGLSNNTAMVVASSNGNEFAPRQLDAMYFDDEDKRRDIEDHVKELLDEMAILQQKNSRLIFRLARHEITWQRFFALARRSAVDINNFDQAYRELLAEVNSDLEGIDPNNMGEFLRAMIARKWLDRPK